MSPLISIEPHRDWSAPAVESLPPRPFAPRHAPALQRMPQMQSRFDVTHILIAEDEQFNRRILRLLLASPRISVVEVDNGEAAIELLKMREFDLMILDTSMPRMNGVDTLKWIRRSQLAWADLPILSLVSRQERRLVPVLTDCGVNAITPKPFDRIDLMEKLHLLAPGLSTTGG